MTPLFANGPALQIRIIIAVVLSLVLMFVDHRLKGFDSIRVYLNSLVSPILYAANLPQSMLDWSAESLSSRKSLLEENAKLRETNLLLQESVLRMQFLQRENGRLRALLESPVRQDIQKMVAEVMSVTSNPNSHQVLLNRGSLNGVYEGQAVLDENGIVGQVVDVAPTTSRVLLITDITHAIPVRISRNSVRSIAAGTGSMSRLELNYVPHSADIRQGDLLVSSGLGQKYPEGYPVAEVARVISNESLPFAQIETKPIAQLDRIRYLLLLWPPNAPTTPTKSSLKEIKRETKELIQ